MPEPVVRVDRTVEGVVLDWDAITVPDRGTAAMVRRRVEALCAHGVDVAVLSKTDLGTVDKRKSDLIRDLLRYWALRGVGPGLLLIVGDGYESFGCAGGDDSLLVPEAARAIAVSVGASNDRVPAGVLHLPTGAQGLLFLLDEQLRRRRRQRVPAIDEDPSWIIRETGIDPLRHRVTETLFTLGAAGLATRGSVEEPAAGSAPMVLAAGVYHGTGPEQHLLPAPAWTGLVIDPAPVEDVRILDLRTGVLVREEIANSHPMRSLRLVSAESAGLVAMRAEAEVGRLRTGPALQQPSESSMTSGRLDGTCWARVRGDAGAGIAAAARQHIGRDGPVRTVERIAAYITDPSRQPALADASAALDTAQDRGFDRLLAEHRTVWAQRWEAVDVRIPDDPAVQLAARFALFQLWCNVNRRDELAVGARGLSGPGYSGHVFWDADVFVLPAIVTIDPDTARAMVSYRHARLEAAREHARASGYHGARFPWESAARGEDVTPTVGHLGGERVPILTGRMEEHVTADVAWSAVYYAEWTADRTFLIHRNHLLTETARYWASRCRRDVNGHAHIDRVIGPDEYHEAVDDNAFTNVLARWNLRQAADALDDAATPGMESRAWDDLAEAIVDGYDPCTGCYEQFNGYYGLEPLRIADFASPPVAADMLLGRDRVAASQIIKQPDVLMMHHMIPEEVQPGSLAANLDFYVPRTAHGSSLSPAITASLLARAGRANEALELFRVALSLDMDDLTGTTASGLHLATMGGVWQALVAGFAGARVRDGVLNLDPCLPTAWGSIELRFHCLGRKVRLHITHERIDIQTNAPLLVQLADGRRQRVVSRSFLSTQGDGGEAS
ncbi:MAG: glycosyl hydrolase family 65 protein [Pseudonocardiaceae bacterium]